MRMNEKCHHYSGVHFVEEIDNNYSTLRKCVYYRCMSFSILVIILLRILCVIDKRETIEEIKNCEHLIVIRITDIDILFRFD